MRFKLLIQVTLAAVIGVRATPVFDFPAVIHRSKIPAGITVHEYNATAAALGAAEAPKLEARNDWHQDSNCKGSGVCHHWVLGSDCISAANRFDPGAYYCGYASRFVWYCTAIYRCYEGYAQCVSGATLKSHFNAIYSEIKCRRCGTCNIPISDEFHKCSVTYNYCHNCKDSG